MPPGGVPRLLKEHNARRRGAEPMPWLAELVACSLYDIAQHDAYGNINSMPVYDIYTKDFMNRDLSSYLTRAEKRNIDFAETIPHGISTGWSKSGKSRWRWTSPG